MSPPATWLASPAKTRGVFDVVVDPSSQTSTKIVERLQLKNLILGRFYEGELEIQGFSVVTRMLNTSEPSAAPVSQLAPGHERSEWLRVSQVVAQYNIGRTFLYELLRDGKLRSVSLKKRGAIRGIRLISRLWLEDYLEHLAEVQSDPDLEVKRKTDTDSGFRKGMRS